jgi:hypothetical protein
VRNPWERVVASHALHFSFWRGTRRSLHNNLSTTPSIMADFFNLKARQAAAAQASSSKAPSSKQQPDRLQPWVEK